MLTGEGGDIDSIYAAEVDAHFRETNSLGMCLHAACFAEEVANLLFVKQIFGEIVFAREEFERIFAGKIQEQPLLLAVRTIALQGFSTFSLKLITNLPAMASASVFHVCSIHEPF